jgi:hypothetical protein
LHLAGHTIPLDLEPELYKSIVFNGMWYQGEGGVSEPIREESRGGEIGDRERRCSTNLG